MKTPVKRTNVRINPDYKKVIPRLFHTGQDRSLLIIKSVLQMDDQEARIILNNIFIEFSSRYRNIHDIFLKHFSSIKELVPVHKQQALSEEKKLLIGSYFTMEYSIEAAALFNPSIVEDPHQEGAGPGEKKVIVSFRATGESHISSLVFKRGLIDTHGMIHFEPSGKFFSEGVVKMQKKDDQTALENLLEQMVLPEDIHPTILNQLQEPFSYKEMEMVLNNAMLKAEATHGNNKIKYDILSFMNTSYEVRFPVDSLLSERVIFPVTITEKNGIEDARFVKFTKDDGQFTYIATYTAYDGSFILPHLMETNDFCHFIVSPLHGKAATNKNLALFPRKINGKYAMLSRIDGVNNYIMFSDDLYLWEDALLLQKPKYPWEFVQIGNAGSPIETEKGWLVITHGVGPMRKYCLGASLFDLDDPTIELGRLKEPLLVPNEEERHGYVPNVVYSCGSIIHGDQLFIPYAVSDYASSFATIPLKILLEEIMSN